MARYPDAIWRPTNKHGYPGNDTHLHQGLVIHSAEGSLGGLFGVLLGPREASWHFSVAQEGRVFQHVDTANIAWTNGSQEANEKFWGIECEGGGPGNLGEPLTEPQYETLLSVVKWLWVTHTPGPPVRRQTLWEHREMTRFGATPTSCPSGRIPWTRLIADLEDGMTDAEYKALIGKLDLLLEKVETTFNQVNAKAGAVFNEVQEQASAVADIVRDEVRAIPGGGGLSENQMRQIIRQEIDKTKLKA